MLEANLFIHQKFSEKDCKSMGFPIYLYFTTFPAPSLPLFPIFPDY